MSMRAVVAKGKRDVSETRAGRKETGKGDELRGSKGRA